MSGSSAARPKDLAMMRHVLDDYCREQELAPGGLMREAIAERIVMLFESGLKDPAAIMAALVDGQTGR